ncbi:MAG: plastocyanin/azurin family copper-binding protein [Balneolaceae bacterium]
MKKNIRIYSFTLPMLIAMAVLGFISLNENQSSTSQLSHIMDESPTGENPALNSVRVSDGDTLTVRAIGADLSYDITEIEAAREITFTIRFDNSESTMPHNVVFVESEEDIMPVGVASLQFYEQEYIPYETDEMEKIFAYSSLAIPGNIVYLTVVVPKEPGSYPYICTYPGHFTQMQGRLIVDEE